MTKKILLIISIIILSGCGYVKASDYSEAPPTDYDVTTEGYTFNDVIVNGVRCITYGGVGGRGGGISCDFKN